MQLLRVFFALEESTFKLIFLTQLWCFDNQISNQNISTESKNKNSSDKKNDYLNETTFNKSNNLSLFNNDYSNKREIDYKSSLTNDSKAKNKNNKLLVDIGLFADLVETTNKKANKTDPIAVIHKNKKNNRDNSFKANLLNNLYEDDSMEGLNNPNFNLNESNQLSYLKKNSPPKKLLSLSFFMESNKITFKMF